MDNLISSKHEKSASHLSIITTQSWFSQMILINLTTHLKVLSTQSIDRDLTSHLKVIKLFQQDWDKYLSHLSIIFSWYFTTNGVYLCQVINHSTIICMPVHTVIIWIVASNTFTSIFIAGIIQLAQNCRSLQTVYLRRCLNLTDEAVIALSTNCPQLRYLNVGGCTMLTDRCLEALGRNSRFLKCLNMANTKVYF